MEYKMISNLDPLPKDDEGLRASIEERAPHLDQKWVNWIVESKIFGTEGERANYFLNGLKNISPESVQYRFQALEKFPFLSERYLVRKNIGFTPDADAEKALSERTRALESFWESIDAGKSLPNALHAFLTEFGYKNIQPAHIKRIAKFGDDLTINENRLWYTVQGKDLKMLDDAARVMDINIFPNSGKDFRTLRRVHNSFCSAMNERMYSDSYRRRFAGFEKFDGLIDSLFSSFRNSDYASINKHDSATSLTNMRDSIGWLKNTVIQPLLHREDYGEGENLYHESALYSVLNSMRVVDIAEFNVFLHANGAKVSRALKAYDEAKANDVVEEWEHRFPAANNTSLPELGEYSVVPLKSRVDLQEAHEVLDVCIDTYAPQSITGRSSNFKIVDKFGMIQSVFELNEYGQLVQHEAFKGAKPSEEISRVAEVYVTALWNDKIKPNQLYGEWQKKVKKFSYTEIYGHDEYDPDRAKVAVETLLEIPSLPKAMRHVLSDAKKWNPASLKESNLFNAMKNDL